MSDETRPDVYGSCPVCERRMTFIDESEPGEPVCSMWECPTCGLWARIVASEQEGCCEDHRGVVEYRRVRRVGHN